MWCACVRVFVRVRVRVLWMDGCLCVRAPVCVYVCMCVGITMCVRVSMCVCVWVWFVSKIKRVLVSARPAPTASASEIACPCIHSRDYSSRYRIITPLST